MDFFKKIVKHFKRPEEETKDCAPEGFARFAGAIRNMIKRFASSLKMIKLM